MNARNWTHEQRLKALMRLPWTVIVERDRTDGSLVARVAEVPDAIATGASTTELAKDLWESLSASLEVRLENGDELPLPRGSALPWDVEEPPRIQHTELRVAQPIGLFEVSPRATAAA